MRRVSFAGFKAAGTSAAALLLLAGALTSGCARGGRGGFSMPPMPVETAAVARGPVADRFEALGSIEAGDVIDVVSEIDGAVVRLPFQEGGRIEHGGLIAQLDDSQLRAEETRTAALRDQARITYERVKSIVDQGAGAPQDLDDAAAALKVAEANHDLAAARLAKTRIVAPFSGILGSRRVSPGAFVRAGQAITDLAQIEELRVIFSAPERYLSALHPGAQVTVTTTAYPGYELKGRINVVETVLDPTTRSARILARIRNPGGKFRPGMSANVTAVLSERPNALTIPNEAVFVENDQSFVYVVKGDSTVTRSALTLGTRSADVVEVVKGLEPGARVVRAGHQKLFEGAKVIPVGAPPGAEAAGAGAPGTAAGGAGAPGAAAPGPGKPRPAGAKR
jgi:membrane fusion protein, multidrug efflux system